VSLWDPAPISPQGLVGHEICAVHPQALAYAVEQLLAIPTSVNLKIPSGEHLAAIWMTALHGPPSHVDENGGIDLRWERSRGDDAWRFDPKSRVAAVEVKSSQGSRKRQWREEHKHMKIGESFQVKVEDAATILARQTRLLERAIYQLDTKLANAPSTAERHVFLAINPLDGFALEAFDQQDMNLSIGHRLPHLQAGVRLDTLWVCFFPDLLARWSQRERKWIDIVIAGGPDGEPSVNLEEAESRFLQGINYAENTPWGLAFN
jgi:23S rRNA pseudoU1915 N3-methylase RlmH